MEKYLNTAIQAVAKASLICKEIQSQLVSEDSITKKDKSPVSIADYASQALICRMLHETFPDIPVVGEEDAHELKNPESRSLLEKIQTFLPGWSADEIIEAIDFGNGEPGNLFWTLDPIDGTKGFLRGEQYAVALALIKDGHVVLGVLGCPNLEYEDSGEGTLLYAIKDEGATTCNFSNDHSTGLAVSEIHRDDKVRFLESVEAGHANHDQQGKVMEAFGEKIDSVRVDSQVKYAVLAQGKAEVYLRLPKPNMPDYREKIWDHAAGVIIVEEADGMVTDINSKALDFSKGKRLTENRGVVVSNGQFHDIIIRNISHE